MYPCRRLQFSVPSICSELRILVKSGAEQGEERALALCSDALMEIPALSLPWSVNYSTQ